MTVGTAVPGRRSVSMSTEHTLRTFRIGNKCNYCGSKLIDMLTLSVRVLCGAVYSVHLVYEGLRSFLSDLAKLIVNDSAEVLTWWCMPNRQSS